MFAMDRTEHEILSMMDAREKLLLETCLCSSLGVTSAAFVGMGKMRAEVGINGSGKELGIILVMGSSTDLFG